MKRRAFLTGILATPAIVAAPNIWVPPRRVFKTLSLNLERPFSLEEVFALQDEVQRAMQDATGIGYGFLQGGKRIHPDVVFLDPQPLMP